MSFLETVKQGRLGKNEGLPNGLGSLNKYIFNTQPKRYYLFGGETGTGKTTMVDQMFVFAPYLYTLEYPEVKVNWKYYSLEQSILSKKISWASKMLYHKYGLRLPSAYLTGKGKNRVSEEHYKLCVTVDEFVETMTAKLDMVDSGITPSQFKNDLFRYGKKKGTWLTRPLYNEVGEQRKNKAGNLMIEIFGWTPNDPEEKHLFLIDHIAYADLEYPSLKQNIDTISRAIVWFREKTNWTFAVIQQFNTELASVERQKFKKSAISPQRVDFGDSRYTFQDADVVFGIINPYNYDIMEYQGYDVSKLEGFGIWTFLMKNRHEGPAGRVIPYLMDPVGGMLHELPESTGTDLLAIEMAGGSDPMENLYAMAQEISNQNQF